MEPNTETVYFDKLPNSKKTLNEWIKTLCCEHFLLFENISLSLFSFSSPSFSPCVFFCLFLFLFLSCSCSCSCSFCFSLSLTPSFKTTFYFRIVIDLELINTCEMILLDPGWNIFCCFFFQFFKDFNMLEKEDQYNLPTKLIQLLTLKTRFPPRQSNEKAVYKFTSLYV